jgi:ProQ/FINO family
MMRFERRPTLTLSRPLNCLTTERLEQAGVVQAQQADNAHHPRHVPADAETLAWNRTREAEWHAAPTALEAMLRELAPAVFNDQPPPLAIGIDVALIALLAGEFEADVVSRFLRDWVHRPTYLAAVARGDVRRDLDGCPIDVPADSAREFAAVLLGRRGGAS